jgi:4-amino-4-deoxy-L-arabinose transferase-like glycosyltransferase
MTEHAYNERRLAWAALLALLIWFVFLLGMRPLNVPDEGRYAEVAREMLITGDYITPRVNGVVFLDKPPLYYWISSFSLRVFGVHEWSIRLVSALFGLVGCGLTFVVSRRVFGARAAWLSVAVLASSPLYFLASQYADMNLTVAVLITAALSCFLLGTLHPWGDPRRRYLMWLAYLSAALATLTKGLIGIVFPMAVIGLWILLRRDWKLIAQMYLPSGMAIYLVVTIPWFALAQRANPDFLHFFFVYQHFSRFAGSGYNNPNPVWFYLPVVLMGMFPWTFAVGHAFARSLGAVRRSPQQEGATIYLLIWVLFVLGFFSIPQSKIVGYILPLVPPLAVLTGALLASLLEDHAAQRSARVHLFLYSALATVFGIGMFVAASHLPRKIADISGIGREAIRIGSFLLTSALAVAAVAQLRRLRLAWGGMLVSGFVLVMAVVHVVGKISPHSIKPLALELRTMIRPEDVVATYQEYYQDLPVYLGQIRPIVVVAELPESSSQTRDNWKREFRLGLEQDPRAQAWIVRDDWLERAARAERRLFVVGPTHLSEELRARYRLYLVKTHGDTTLFSNRQVPLAESPELTK